MLRWIVPPTLALVLVGCPNVHPRTFGPGDTGLDGDSDTDTDADTDTDSDTDTDTSDTDSGDSGPGPSPSGFDDPGDVVGLDDQDEDEIVEIDLTDASGDSNQDQEFYLVVVNTGSDELGYRLRYHEPSDDTDTADTAPRPAPPSVGRRPTRPALPIRPLASPPPEPPLDSSDIGTTRDEFLVRTDLELTTAYAPVSATLWALGDNVAIWVDDDVPVDWDQDCDGTVDVPSRRDAYGFDNCDLADVAEIIDSNIIPNVRALYGEESDINGDGRVSVVITPELNAITRTSDDEDDYSRVLPSYAEPNVDLADFDIDTNPGSDEQEVIYVFAPDPNGFYNPSTNPTIESYTGYQLAAEVARSFTTLVSYNQHHLEAGGSVEEDWVNDVLGTFAAEYCGFGVNYHGDAWEYLDAPHKYPLAAEGGRGSLATLSRGAQYLFGLWLYEQAEAGGAGAGAELLRAVMQTDTTGTDSIDGAVAASGGSFQNLVVGWQVALLTSGVTTPDGDPLVDPDDWAPYPEATTISAPPDAPDGFYGANGYQRGLDLRGDNHAFRFGTTDSPQEIPERLTRMENTDAFIYTPGFEFYGWLDANYAAQVVRLTGISYDEAVAELQTTSSDIVGAVVRWNDPVTSDLEVEYSFSPTSLDPVTLPDLPEDGTVIHGVGELTNPGVSDSVDPDGVTEEIEVEDTDRWILDLGDRVGESVTVAVWLERRFADTTGTIGPSDPWIAIVPIELVPEPTVDGTARGECDGGEDFAYPDSLLEYLAAQVFLSSTMYDGDEDEFDACGESSGDTTTCADDWDRDGVLDEDEPVPSTFLEQVRVMECTQNGNVAPEAWTVDTSWLDADEQDEDDLPSQSLVENTGGRSGVTGEEGFVQVELEGGAQYVIVVGANSGGTGTYELSVREIE